MLGSAFWLTLATLLGLCLGFAREWLLVAAWGAGERSDAFLIALFLPEALRMSLAGGVLSAAALPLYLQRKDGERLDWLAVLFPALLLIALVTSLLLTLLAPWLVQLLGPGLAATATSLASSNLQILAWSVPGLMLHALFSIPLQASERFVVAGLGSLLFNLPPVTYLALAGTATQPHSLGVGLPHRQPADAPGAVAVDAAPGLAAVAAAGFDIGIARAGRSHRPAAFKQRCQPGFGAD